MYGSATAADLLEENRRFVDSVVFDPGGDRRLHTLLTAPYGYVNARTALIYGVAAPGRPDRRRRHVAGRHRRPRRGHAEAAAAGRQPAGRDVHPGAFLAAHASSDDPKLVARGSLVREQVLCGEVPPPPDDFKFDDSKITDDMTAREKFVLHASSPFCARCHALFDGIGFALESYDAIGRFRRTDKDKPIDPSGSLTVAPGRPELALRQLRRSGRPAGRPARDQRLLLAAVPHLRHRPHHARGQRLRGEGAGPGRSPTRATAWTP